MVVCQDDSYTSVECSSGSDEGYASVECSSDSDGSEVQRLLDSSAAVTGNERY
jgi:hypothetical protein